MSSHRSVDTLEEDQIASLPEDNLDYNALVTADKKSQSSSSTSSKKVKLPPQKA
jgi:hypothetical protein